LDHRHEKLDFPADYTEFIKHVKKRIDIASYDDNEIGHADATLDTPDDPKPISHKRKRTDIDVTLPERIRKLFLIYIL